MRIVWFVAGTVAGVYATQKAKNAAYRLSMPGMIDQVAALGVGARAFSAELADGMGAKEHQLRTQLLAPDPAHHVDSLPRARAQYPEQKELT
jgi:hypothetical protein